MAARVASAREAQNARYETEDSQNDRRALNVDADGDMLEKHAMPDSDGQALLTDAAVKLSLSARAYHRVLKVARTIADLDGATGVKRIHVTEALSYRRRPVVDARSASTSALAY